MNIITVTILFVALVLTIGGCKDIGEISKKPTRIGQAFVFNTSESIIGVRFSLNLDEVESVVNKHFSEPISGEENGEFSETYTAKTGDPLYHPRKWIKTKDPLYNPNKWIEKCWSYNIGVIKDKRCAKTKNPLYHPRKWMMTKDPLYHPNKWMYTSVQVDIGYNAEYKIVLSDRLEFENISGNKLKIDIPLSIDGSAGFRGDLAKIGLVDKKNIDADVTFSFIVGMSVNSDWCPAVDITSSINWLKGPRIEIVGNTWMSFNLAAKVANLGLEPAIEKALNDAIDCDPIKTQLAKIMIPSSLPLTDKYGGFSLNISPISIYAPTINFDNRDMILQIGTKFAFGVGESSIESESTSLPKLTKSPEIENIIDVNLPLFIPYNTIDNALNLKQKELESKLNEKLSEVDSGIVKKFELNKFEVYPNNDRLVLGLDFKIDTGTFFTPKGRAYLTAKPIISEDYVLYLTNVDLNASFENKAYELALGIMKEFLESKIEGLAIFDLSSKVENGKKEILEKIEIQLNGVNEITVSVTDPELDLSDDIINHQDFLIKNLKLKTGLEVKLNILNIDSEILATRN